MCDDSNDSVEMEEFEASTAATVSHTGSLDELESRLQAYESVAFVKLEEYVLKTFPPRREFTIGLKQKGGLIRKKVLTIRQLEDDKFEFHAMRDENQGD